MDRIDQSDTIDGINNNTYNALFIDGPFKSRLVSNDREYLSCAIDEFTKLSDEDIEYVVNNTDVFERVKNGFVAKHNDKKYKFILLDSFFGEDKKEELRSSRRQGKCVQTSIGMAYTAKEDCKVAVGYLDDSMDRVLHAVFVDCSSDEEYVFDFSKNLVMRKEDYCDLQDYRIINEIKGEDIKKDMKVLRTISFLASKLYLCYRNEIMKDLKKNKKMLKLDI